MDKVHNAQRVHDSQNDSKYLKNINRHPFDRLYKHYQSKKLAIYVVQIDKMIFTGFISVIFI